MAAPNQEAEWNRDLSFADGVLEYSQRPEQTEHENEPNERTWLLQKPNGDPSAANVPQIHDPNDIEAARKQDDTRTHLLSKAVEAIVAPFATLMAGSLMLLPFWILIAFLLATLRYVCS